MPVENVVFARRHESNCLCLPLHREIDHRRSIHVFGEEIIPRLQDNRVYKNNLSRNIARLFEVSFLPFADIHDRHVFHRSQRGRPRNRNGPHTK